MKDLGSLMQQAQAVQQKMVEAQEKIGALQIEGTAGGGAVTLILTGAGELVRLDIDEAVVQPGEREMIADLVIAAHADAKRKLDDQQATIMREAAGPLAGLNLPGMPKF